MKSLRQAISLYRTMAAEALEQVYYEDRFYDLGHRLGGRLDTAAYTLSRRLRPAAAAGRPLGPEWQDLGWTTEDGGVNFAKFQEELHRPFSDALGAYFDKVFPPLPPEWLQIRKADLMKYATVDDPATRGQFAADSFYGIPLHLDPDNEEMLRIRLEDIQNSPRQQAINDLIANWNAAAAGAFPQRFMAGMTSEDVIREYERPKVELAEKLHEEHRKQWEQVAHILNGAGIEWGDPLSDLDASVDNTTPDDDQEIPDDTQQ